METHTERQGEKVEGRVVKGDAGTREAYGNEEYDWEMGLGGGRGESCCHVSQHLRA